MNKLILVTALALTACTSVTQYHESCMANLPTFVQRAACVQGEISKDSRLRNDPLAQEYVLTAVELAHQVQAHKLTDDQAQLQLTHKLNEINDLRIREAAAQDAYDEPAFAQPVFVGGYYRH